MTMPKATLLKLLPIAKAELHMEEDSYRDVLKRHGATLKYAKYSASTMSAQQMENALAEFKAKGFKVKSSKSHDWRAARIGFIKRLWKLLAESNHKDKVRDSSLGALKAWCAHFEPEMTQLEWASAVQLNNLIDRLKSWCKRIGVAVR